MHESATKIKKTHTVGTWEGSSSLGLIQNQLESGGSAPLGQKYLGIIGTHSTRTGEGSASLGTTPNQLGSGGSAPLGEQHQAFIDKLTHLVLHYEDQLTLIDNFTQLSQHYAGHFMAQLMEKIGQLSQQRKSLEEIIPFIQARWFQILLAGYSYFSQNIQGKI